METLTGTQLGNFKNVSWTIFLKKYFFFQVKLNIAQRSKESINLKIQKSIDITLSFKI